MRPESPTDSNLALANLRTFVTVLVVAHHAALAYHPHAPPPPISLHAPPLLWPAFPVVDAHRWAGVGLFVGFNDVFFMSLMFLLSGLFVWPSLRRRGAGAFLVARFRRLGLPFVAASLVLAPIAYAATYFQTGAHRSLTAFWREWLSLPFWPSGPAWFIWVLLVFDGVAAVLFALASARRAPGRWSSYLAGRPALVFVLLVIVSAAGYVPLALVFGPFRWFTLGPFAIQSSRPLLYAVYFFAGAALGAVGLDRTLLASKLARRWLVWCLAALGAFVATALALMVALSGLSRGKPPGLLLQTIGSASFVLSCASSVLAFLALFLRFAREGGIPALNRSAYGIYLLHYVFVTWLQYSLLDAELSAVVKASIVFAGALALSWAAVVSLKRAFQRR